MFLLIIIVIVASIELSEESLRSAFNDFKVKYKKSYSESEESQKYQVFLENYETALTLNDDESDLATYGVTKFFDITQEEFRKIYLTRPPKKMSFSDVKEKYVGLKDTPTEFDWRKEKQIVASVKDQGNCGSCWIFSAVGCLEGAWALAKGEIIDFSEGQILDCDTGGEACNGGYENQAIEYAIQYGLEKLIDYPYHPHKSKCEYDEGKVYGNFTKVTQVKPAKDVQALMDGCYTHGPITFALDADKLMYYDHGIVSGNCGKQIDHAVLGVGWGSESGTDFWIVKNSWAADWGEDGYFRIIRGKDECGIEEESYYVEL